VIINRDGIGDTRVEDYCRLGNIPLLLRIPHERRIAQAYSRGETLAHAFPEWREPLYSVYQHILATLPTKANSKGDD
jgi:MinD superfamily P-loop ATPase